MDDLKATLNLFKHPDRGCDRNFGFLKKDDLLLLPIEGRVFNRRRAFDRFACVDAHLWLRSRSQSVGTPVDTPVAGTAPSN